MSALLFPACVYVPLKYVDDPNIGADVLAVITFILYENLKQINISTIKNRFGFGDTVWRRISKELKKLGILSIVRTQQGAKLMVNEEFFA